MANLLDTIRQNKPGVTDESQKLQGLLRAKSGKAVAGPEVASSNLGEQQAVAQSQQQIQNEVVPQAQIQEQGQRQQTAGIKQAESQQVQGIEQSRRFDTIENRLKTQQILNDLERNKGQIDLARDKAQLEQVGQNLRLQNKQYIDNLQREGNRARLGNQAEFQEALADSVLGDSRELLEKNLGNKSILDATDRDFQKSLTEMDVNHAYDMFKREKKEQKERALYQSIGGLTQAGIGAAGSMKSGSPAASPSTGSTVATGDISSGSASRTA